ncbi:hypothetical protein BGX26_000635 [Mortierella sp. AD094]|nr:hypothetical protein BGX26_000635 [Mortierella sp. AD094]
MSSADSMYRNRASFHTRHLQLSPFSYAVSTNPFDCGEILDFQPGEIASSASTIRKNSDCNHRQGRKMDGIVYCNTTRLDLYAIGAGKLDNGSRWLASNKKF